MRRSVTVRSIYDENVNVIVVKDIFRKYPNRYESIISTLAENLENLDEQEAKLPPLVAGLTPTEAQPIIAQYNTKVRDALSKYAANY